MVHISATTCRREPMGRTRSFSQPAGAAQLSRIAMASPQLRHFHFCFPDKRGKRSTDWCGGRELHLLPGTATIPCGTAHLSVLHCADCRDFVSTRPGPALPGITGCKREVCTPSPAPVQRAPRSPDTRWTGMMPRPPANRSDEPPSAEPASAPPKAVAADDVPHDERAHRK
jgi:hypothetical protein